MPLGTNALVIAREAVEPARQSLNGKRVSKMKDAAYILAIAGALAFGFHHHHAEADAKEAQLSAARDANEQIQLAMAESECESRAEPDSLCSHLKQAQIDVDNTIYRINGGHS